MMQRQWHQLDHMQIICTSHQTHKNTSTSALSFFRDRMPFLPPNQYSVKALKANTQTYRKTLSSQYFASLIAMVNAASYSRHSIIVIALKKRLYVVLINLAKCENLREALGKVGEEQIGLVTLTLAMLHCFVVEESVQFHRLVRRRTVLVLTTRTRTSSPRQRYTYVIVAWCFGADSGVFVTSLYKH